MGRDTVVADHYHTQTDEQTGEYWSVVGTRSTESADDGEQKDKKKTRNKKN